MAKKVIQLTEEELHNMIQECVSSVCTEMDIKQNHIQQGVQAPCLKDFVGKTFKFFAEDMVKLVAHLLFTFEKVTKFDLNKTILVGNVVFNNKQINGDRIVIDFSSGKVLYHESGSRYEYNLEVDNRFKPLWDKLYSELQTTISHMK